MFLTSDVTLRGWEEKLSVCCISGLCINSGLSTGCEGWKVFVREGKPLKLFGAVA